MVKIWGRSHHRERAAYVKKKIIGASLVVNVNALLARPRQLLRLPNQSQRPSPPGEGGMWGVHEYWLKAKIWTAPTVHWFGEIFFRTLWQMCDLWQLADFSLLMGLLTLEGWGDFFEFLHGRFMENLGTRAP